MSLGATLLWVKSCSWEFFISMIMDKLLNFPKLQFSHLENYDDIMDLTGWHKDFMQIKHLAQY